MISIDFNYIFFPFFVYCTAVLSLFIFGKVVDITVFPLDHKMCV